MKKIYIFLFTILACLSANASEAIAPAFQYDGIWYEPISDTECRTKAATNLSIETKVIPGAIYDHWDPVLGNVFRDAYEYNLIGGNGPNTLNWNQNTMHSQVPYGDKTLTLVEIGDFSFAGNLQANTFELPSTVTRIGKGAFCKWTNGASFDLDLSNVEVVDDYAFCGTTTVKSITFGKTKYLGASAFEGNNNGDFNNSIDIQGVEIIGPRAFYNCDFQKITIGDSVKRIEDSAFYGSRRTTSLSLGKNLEWIGDYAFYDCPLLDELTIPDSCLHIGNYAFYNCVKICPVDFGKGLQWIGDYAFWNAHWDCSNIIDLPASLKHIGVWGFMFNRTADVRETDTDITDIYIHAVEPPELPVDENGHCAWGDLDVNLAGFWDVDGMWMFPYLCLHVPQGSRSDYESHPYWGKFKCIIDDLLPEDGLTADPEDPDNDGKGSIQNIVGYVFISIAPNETNAETLTLSKDLFPTSTIDVDEWVLYNDKNIVKFKEGSKDVIQPLALGEQLILGYNNTLNETWDNGKKDWVKERSLVGAVMVFVCPTITLVYDNDLQTNTPVVSSRSNNRALSSVGDPVESSSDYEGVISQNASYQHTVVYNSYPKVELLEPAGVHFEVLQKGHFDENGTWTNDYSQLEEVDEDTQRVGPGAETEGNYVVPNTSITENRVLKINTSIDEHTLGTTTVANIEVNNRISLSANGRTITINGADDSDVVKIYDLKGVLLYNTTDKTITLSAPGVYIINIDGENIKAQVR